MKKGTNTKMKYQQGQTRLSSQYAKTYVSLLPYQGADHLTFEAWGGGGWVGNFWSARICLQDFFLKQGQSRFLQKCIYIYIVAIAVMVPIWSCKAEKFSKLYKIILEQLCFWKVILYTHVIRSHYNIVIIIK